MNDYTKQDQLIEGLKAMEDLWSQGKHEEHNNLSAQIEAQWPGFQVRRSTPLKKYGLFPKGTDQEAWEADQSDLSNISREWDAYRRG